MQIPYKRKRAENFPPVPGCVRLVASSASHPRKPPAARRVLTTPVAPGRESSSSEYVQQRLGFERRLHTPRHQCGTDPTLHQTPRSQNRCPLPTRDTCSPNSRYRPLSQLPAQTRSCCSSGSRPQRTATFSICSCFLLGSTDTSV